MSVRSQILIDECNVVPWRRFDSNRVRAGLAVTHVPSGIVVCVPPASRPQVNILKAALAMLETGLSFVADTPFRAVSADTDEQNVIFSPTGGDENGSETKTGE